MKQSSDESRPNSAESLLRQIAERLVPPQENSKEEQAESTWGRFLADTPESFIRFAKLLGYSRLYLDPHGRYERFLNFLHSASRRKLMLMPRGSYKSTCLQIFAMREILKNPDIRILYCSETFSNSKEHIGGIRRHFEANPIFKKIFGDWVGKDDWRQEKFRVNRRADLSKRESTVTAAGIDVTKTGMHYDIIIVDDAVSNTNVLTANQMQKTHEWYQLLLSILDPGGVMIVCGTRYDEEDLYGTLINKNPKLEAMWERLDPSERSPDAMPYEVLIERAENTEGLILFPHFSRAFLESKKIEQGSYIYSCQYLNDPVNRDNAIFTRDMFRLIRSVDVPKPLNRYLLADTATTPDGCDSVLSVIGRDSIGNCYVLDMITGRWNPGEFILNFFSFWIKWNPRWLVMEKVPINDNYASMIEREAMERQIRVKVVWVMGRTQESKDARIISMQGPMAAGKIYFSDEIAKDLIHRQGHHCFGEIPRQFVRFRPGSGGRKDIPDCLSDAFKRDRRSSAELCPCPRVRNAHRNPDVDGTVNGRYAREPKSIGTPGGDMWSELKRRSDLRRRHG